MSKALNEDIFNKPEQVEEISLPVTEEEEPKSKGFSLQELRELRERWGTGTKAEPSAQKTKTTSKSDVKSSTNSSQTPLEHQRGGRE